MFGLNWVYYPGPSPTSVHSSTRTPRPRCRGLRVDELKQIFLKGTYFRGVETTSAFNTRGQPDDVHSTCTALPRSDSAL